MFAHDTDRFFLCSLFICSLVTAFDFHFDRLAWNELIMTRKMTRTRKVTRKIPSHHAAKSADLFFFSSKSDLVVPSYDQKTEKFHDYEIHDY